MPFMTNGKRDYQKEGRICSVCGLFLSWESFSSKRTARYLKYEGVAEKQHLLKQPTCKRCAVEKTKEWKESKTKEQIADLYYKRIYGISLAQFNAMLQRQNSKCALCDCALNMTHLDASRAVVDHDHVTGNVRGILCNECNRGLGYFHDNAAALLKAANYITNNIDLREME
jgi:beta-galactosidase/beta-glucuronidase